KSAAGRADREDGRSFLKPDQMDLGVRLDRDGKRTELTRDGRGKVKQVEHRGKPMPLCSLCQTLSRRSEARRLIRSEGYATFSACAEPRGARVAISLGGRVDGED